MIHDAFLRFATNQRPQLSLLGVTTLYPLPLGDPITPSGNISHDLRAVMDLGSGYPLKARFEIKTTFTSADATLFARFGIAISDDPNFAGINQQVLCASERLTVSGGVAGLVPMTAGSFYELTMPKLSTTHNLGLGRRFVHLVMDITTVIALGNALFTAGALDAYMMLDSDQEPRLPPHASGFVV